MEFIDLEAIDMTWPREKIREVLMHQLQNLGFLCLTNLPDYDEEELFKQNVWVFNLPEDEKKKLYQNHHNKDSKNYYRGLCPFLPNDVSHKELYDMGVDYD